MDRQKRLNLIEEIEQERKTALLCYVTGDRENVSTRIAPDVIRIFFRHLENLGPKPRIDLFLYTRGGDVLTPWRLVNLIREYTEDFTVLVPFRCYSAGTLICLGADQILMGKMGELGPIDPSVANAFNPDDPKNPQAKVPVSVEDVISYLGLAHERAGLENPEHLVEVFTHLSEKVHPLALGNVHRNYSLIRFIARRLLELHSHNQPTAEIIDYLTEKLYAHNYMIPRREAKNEIGLNVITPSPALEKLIWELYKEYEKHLNLLEPLTANVAFPGGENSVDFEARGGVIESRDHLDTFVFEGQLLKAVTTEGEEKININMRHQSWRRME